MELETKLLADGEMNLAEFIPNLKMYFFTKKNFKVLYDLHFNYSSHTWISPDPFSALSRI